jgi:hypothetical protein
MSRNLTAPERETVILLSDADGVARISTHQPTILTKLRNNPAAVEIEDLSFGTTRGASFEIPASLISFRTKRRVLSPEQRVAAAERLRAATRES